MKPFIFVLAAFAMLGLQPQETFKRERGGTTDKAKDSHELKAPPAIVAEKWMNTEGSKPLDWKSLKGKVVLLDLWAFW